MSQHLELKYANAIIKTLREPFLVLDKTLRVISSNRSFYNNFKVTEKETIGQSLPDLGNGQWNIPELIHLLKEILPQNTFVTDYEIVHNFETIGERIVNLNAHKLRISKRLLLAMTKKGEKGEKDYEEGKDEELILLAIEDITQRRQVEELLETAKAKDDAILASIGDAVMTCDNVGRIILFNRAAERLTGYSYKEVAGKNYKGLIRFVKESDGKPIDDFIDKTIKTGKETKISNHALVVKKDGSKTPVEDSSAPVITTNGALIGCVVVFRDVTHERDVDKAKTEFASLSSHQLKTPPTSIKWLTEILLNDKTGKLNEEQKGYLDEIHSKNEQMIKLVNTLLDVSRLELGTFAITPIPIDSKSLVRSVINSLAFEISAKKLHLKEKYPQRKLIIRTDINLLRIIIQNLLENAIKYTKKNGKIMVEVSKNNKENSLVFEIADTGCGIPKKQQDKIFTKLFRADNAKKKYPDGTGLGLYIVKSIITKAGGSISFTSKENKGSTFHVSIPLSNSKVMSV